MTLARRYVWSGTPLTAGQGPAAAHLKATASAADLSGLAGFWPGFESLKACKLPAAGWLAGWLGAGVWQT